MSASSSSLAAWADRGDAARLAPSAASVLALAEAAAAEEASVECLCALRLWLLGDATQLEAVALATEDALPLLSCGMLVPRLRRLSSPAPRTVLKSLELLHARSPSLLAATLLGSLLTVGGEGGKGPGAHQLEAALRACRATDPRARGALLALLFQPVEERGDDASMAEAAVRVLEQCGEGRVEIGFRLDASGARFVNNALLQVRCTTVCVMRG